MSGKKFNWGILGPGRIAHQLKDYCTITVISNKIEGARQGGVELRH